MTRLYKIPLITLLALLFSCDAKDSTDGIKPLDDIYGEWSYSKVEGDVRTKIELDLYIDSHTTGITYITQYGSTSIWREKELSADHLSFYNEINGQREIELKFKILKSNENSMTVVLLEASQNTRVQNLRGQTLIFQINRKQTMQPPRKKKSRARWHC